MYLQNSILCAAIYIAAQSVFICSPATADDSFLSGSVYETVGMQENIDPFLLYSISLLESAHKDDSIKDAFYVAPSPFVIRGPKGAVYPKSYAEAVKALHKLIRTYGARRLDIGLMQINGQHLHKVSSPEDLLNPYTNVRVGAEILRSALEQNLDLELAIGRYHSPTEWRARTYGARVLAVYNNLRGL